MAEGPPVEVPLNELYATCKEQYENCMEASLPEAEYMMLIETFRKLLKDIKKANLWSKNESIEEVATSAIPYFLVPHLFINLLLQCPYGHRPTVMEEVLVWHGLFLDRCLAMEAMNSNDRKLYDREEGENDPSPEERRNHKIQRLKRNKEMNEKVKWIEEKRKEMNITEANAFQYENLERKLYLIQLDQAIGEDMQLTQTINLELQLAEMHEKQKSTPKRERKRYRARARPPPKSSGVTFIGPDGRTRKFKNLAEYRANAKEIQEAIDNPSITQASVLRSAAERVTPSVPVVQSYQAPVKADKPKAAALPKNIIPGVVNMDPIGSRVDKIVNKRENTFKEYVERWTYSVEEGFDFDVMTGKVQLETPEEPPPKKEDDEMTEEEFDEEQKKRRAWDDFKESHKKGSGNPYYHPGR